MYVYILKTLLFKGHPSEHQLGTKVSRGKLHQVTENHIRINEAESNIREFHSLGSADMVEQADEGHREHQAAWASHPPQTQSIQVTSEELVGVECLAVLIAASQKPGEKTQALRKCKDESLQGIFLHTWFPLPR